MTALLMSLFGLALVALAGVGLLYGERQRQARLDEKADHAKCTAHVTSVVSNHFVAARLRDLAELWDSTDNEPELARIRNVKYQPGGPTVVALWMQEKADELVEDGS